MNNPSAGDSHEKPKDFKELQKVLFIDGIHYSFLMTRLAYSRLCSDLLALSQNDYLRRKEGRETLSKQDSFSHKISAISNSWQVIDSVNRLRELLRKTPDLKQNAKELQLFFRQTIDVEHLRDNVQHLNEQIVEYVQKKILAWGTLNWVAKLDETEKLLFSLMPGSLFERETPLLNPCGRKITVPIGLVTLCVDKEICLSELVETQLSNIVDWLQPVLKTAITGIAQSALASLEYTPKKG